jgi:hypothetical protein
MTFLGCGLPPLEELESTLDGYTINGDDERGGGITEDSGGGIAIRFGDAVMKLQSVPSGGKLTLCIVTFCTRFVPGLKALRSTSEL